MCNKDTNLHHSTSMHLYFNTTFFEIVPKVLYLHYMHNTSPKLLQSAKDAFTIAKVKQRNAHLQGDHIQGSL